MLVGNKISILSKLTQICVEKKDYAAGLLYCNEAIILCNKHADGLGSEEIIKIYQLSITLCENGGFLERKSEIMPLYIQFVSTIPNGLPWSLQLSFTEAAQLFEVGLNEEANQVLRLAADMVIDREIEARGIALAQDIIIKYGNTLFEKGEYEKAEFYLKKALSLESLT
jgi:tetratricopeptide (TPR) repeat protein